MNRLWRVVLGLCIFLGTSIPVLADRIDDAMRAEMSRQHVPGLAVAIVKGGRVTLARGYGLSNVETGSRVTPESVFELASVTKPITATAVMMLVEAGKIGLDDKITKYLPDAPAAWGPITVRQLLAHTAGLAEFVDLPPHGDDISTAEMYAAVKPLPMGGVPGEQFGYSDIGYFLLGMIIERASGESYRQFVTGCIFEPLGMRATRVIDQWEIVPNRASGYALRGGKLVHNRRTGQVETPSFYGVLSTVLDLAKFDAALYTDKLLSKRSLDLMWTPANLDNGQVFVRYAGTIYGGMYMGLGWGLHDYRGRRILVHTGWTGTEILRLPDEELTCIVLTNLDAVSQPHRFATILLGLYNPALRPPGMLEEQRDPDPERTGRFLAILSSISRGAEDPAETAGTRAFAAALSQDDKSAISEHLRNGQPLRFLGSDDVKCRHIARYGEELGEVCYYRLGSDGKAQDWSFFLARNGRIVDVTLSPD